MHHTTDELPDDGRPPLFKKWRAWYWLVLAVLAGQIILYYLITLHYS